MVSMFKRQQPRRDETFQLKATHGSLMNDEETLTPLCRLLLIPKTLYTGTMKWLKYVVKVSNLTYNVREDCHMHMSMTTYL